MADAMEERMSSLLRDRAMDELASLALEAYGAELYGFLVHVVRDPTSVADVFWRAIDDFWRELPGSRGSGSVRIWLYQIAYRAAVHHHRSPLTPAPGTGDSRARQIAAALTRTAQSRRGDLDDKWRHLRREIAAEDRALLVLRVDRGLAWPDIAQIMRRDRSEDPAAVAHLRKRFGLLKDQLRARARAVGLR